MICLSRWTRPLLVCAAASASGAYATPSPGAVADPSEVCHGIYSAIAQHVLDSSTVQTVVIARTTSGFSPLDSGEKALLKGQAPAIPDALLDRFGVTGPECLVLTDSFRVDGSYVLLDDSMHAALEADPEQAWALLRERHGEVTALVAFSRPAIAPDGETALVHYHLVCGRPMCQEWHYVFLRRRGDSWAVETDVLTMIT